MVGRLVSNATLLMLLLENLPGHNDIGVSLKGYHIQRLGPSRG